MKNKYSYIWVSLVILVFGIIFIPEIVDRIKAEKVVDASRMNSTSTDGQLSYITLN